MMERLNSWIALAGRVLIASLFLISAVGKLSAPAGTISYIAMSGLPMPTLGYGVALVVEGIVPVLLIVGYRTRAMAAVLAVFSIVTALAFHAQLGNEGQFINFFKNIVIAGGLLQIVAFGGGRLSLDKVQAKAR